MTRSVLISKLALRFPQLAKADVDIYVKEILDAIGDRLAEDGRVELRGFGSFGVNIRPPKNGRNPRTGNLVAVPEKRAPHFKVGKELREMVAIKTNDQRML